MLLYLKLSGASRRVEPGCMGKSRGPRAAKLGALSPAKVSFGQVLDQRLVGVDAAAALWEFQPGLVTRHSHFTLYLYLDGVLAGLLIA